jgi:hypothetical protein
MAGNAFVFMKFQEGSGLLFGIGGVLGGERRGFGGWGLAVGYSGLASEPGLSWKTSEAVLAWAEGDSVGRVVDVVGWEGKMDKGAA